MVCSRKIKVVSLFIGTVCAWLPDAFGVDKGLTRSKIKLGVILPLSGPMASYGREVLKGIEIGHSVLGSENPELHQKITWQHVDNKNLSRESEKVSVELLKHHKVQGMIGGLISSNSVAISAVSAQYRVPFLSIASPSPSHPKNSFIAHSCSITPNQGKLIARFAAKDLGVKKAALLTEEDSGHADSVIRNFSEHFRAVGGRVVGRFTYQPSAQSFDTLIRQIAASNPQVVVLPAHYEDVVAIVRAAKQVDPQMVFIGTDSWEADARFFSKENNKVLAGNYFVSTFSAADPHPDVQVFAAAFHKKFGYYPGSFAAMGYESYKAMSLAFKRANTSRAAVLAKNLQRRQCLGFGGPVIQDEKGVLQKPVAVLQTTVDGPRFHSRLQL